MYRYDSQSSLRCLVSLFGVDANIPQLRSPIIFDSMFSSSIFPNKFSNFSNSSIEVLGGLYQFERRNGLAPVMLISTHKIQGRDLTSRF